MASIRLDQRVVLRGFTVKLETNRIKTCHRFVDPEKNTNSSWIMPKKETAGTQQSAASLRARIKVCAAHGTLKAPELKSNIRFCTPLCFPLMLAPLSYPCPRISSRGIFSFNRCFLISSRRLAASLKSIWMNAMKCSHTLTIAWASIWFLVEDSAKLTNRKMILICSYWLVSGVQSTMME